VGEQVVRLARKTVSRLRGRGRSHGQDDERERGCEQGFHRETLHRPPRLLLPRRGYTPDSRRSLLREAGMSIEDSYLVGTGRAELLGETVGRNLDRTAARFPDRDALVSVHQGIRLTYAAFHAAVEVAARGLMAQGVEPRDRVGIWSPNCAEWTVLQYATAKIGAILVNINPAYRASELAYVLKQSGTRHLVLAARYRGADYTALLEEASREIGPLASAVLLAGTARAEDGQAAPAMAETVGATLSGAAAHAITWSEMLDCAARVPVDALRERERQLQFDDPINIQYTSGTTGFPKGATLSHHNILNNGKQIGDRCRYTEADRVCIPVPLYHCFGMVLGNLACTTHGAAIIYPSEGFDAAAALAAVAAERCTSLYGVPTMFIAELDHPHFARHDLSSLRTGIMAGSPCPVELMNRVRSQMHMPEVTIAYGMTETSPVSFQTCVDDPVEKRVETVGRIHPYIEAKVVDPATGRIVPRGVPGELLIRGYVVMLGYWENEGATRSAIDEARWMHTGDQAAIDAEGYCHIVGRIKDMVIRGGENIYPREVEEFLYRHPSISEVQVIGVPDPKYGEELCAWVRLKEGESCTTHQLRAWCRGKMAAYKIPRYWKLTDAFPTTVTGKIQKYKMREQSIRELGL
jgi:fatty-acyl-CoA synthase